MWPALGRGFSWLAVLVSLGCAVLSDRPSLTRFEGQMLRSSDAAGIDALTALKERTEAIKFWIVREGEPDYVFVESPRSVFLFYVDKDRLVRFTKPVVGGKLQGAASQPIRSDHYMLFSNDDRERLARARIGQPQRAAEPRREGVVRRRVGENEEDEGGAQSGDRPR